MAKFNPAKWQLFKPEETNAALELIGVVHGVRYTLTAVCPRCDRRFTAAEVLAGSHHVPDDTDFVCWSCHSVMNPMIIVTSRFDPEREPVLCRFLCASEALVENQDRTREFTLSLDHSLRICFGCETTAANIAAGFGPHLAAKSQPVLNWRALILPFADRLSPETIARIVHARPCDVRLTLAAALGQRTTTMAMRE